MKKLLSALFLVGTVIAGYAAQPTYESFDTNDFLVTQPTIHLQPWDKLWTNNGGVYLPTATNQNELHATNVNAEITLHANGAFLFSPVGPHPLQLGENDFNPYNQGYEIFSSTTTNSTDTWLRLSTGNGAGTLLFLQNGGTNTFEMLNGDQLWDNPAGHLYLSGGDWRPNAKGETILLLGTPEGWAEVQRFGNPTNVVFNPGMVKVDNADTTLAFLSAKLLVGSGLTLVTNNVSGNESLTLSVTPGTNCQNYLLVGGTNISVTSGTVGTNTTITIDSTGDNLWQFTGGFLQPKDLTQSLYWTNKVSLNTGHTDTLLVVPGTDDLRYTNNATQVGLEAQSGNRNISMLVVSGLGSIQTTETELALTASSKQLNITTASGGSVAPSTAAAFSLGTGTLPFTSLYLTNTAEVMQAGAWLTVGDATFVDMTKGTQTNEVSGAVTINYATNGVDYLELKHVRVFRNFSGSDQTFTLNAGWHTNFFSAVPPKLTNNTITKMWVTSYGATSTAATQTNVVDVEFSYYK